MRWVKYVFVGTVVAYYMCGCASGSSFVGLSRKVLSLYEGYVRVSGLRAVVVLV